MGWMGGPGYLGTPPIPTVTEEFLKTTNKKRKKKYHKQIVTGAPLISPRPSQHIAPSACGFLLLELSFRELLGGGFSGSGWESE